MKKSGKAAVPEKTKTGSISARMTVQSYCQFLPIFANSTGNHWQSTGSDCQSARNPLKLSQIKIFTQKWPVRGIAANKIWALAHVQTAAWRVYPNEVPRTEFPNKTHPSSGNRSKRPARSSPRSKRLTLAVAGVIFCARTAGLAQDGTDWSRSGDFHLSGGFTSASLWQFSADQWTALDAFERASPARPPLTAPTFALRENVSQLDQLLELIAAAEAGSAEYDAVHMGARIRPPAPPTQMTIAEIFAWIEATPRQPHAIGRYQFIPSTLARLVASERLSERQRFSPALQSQLAKVLIYEAGYQRFEAGQISRSQMMDNLAAVWAGLPLANGRSVYHGYAGNRATITRASYASGMEEIYGPE